MFIVSFATPKYEVEAAILLRDMQAFNIPHEVHFIPDMGGWLQANFYKAEFIKAMLIKHNRPVVWLDADTEIREYPALFDELTCDFAVNYFKNTQLAAGMMYFGNTLKAYALLHAWTEENKKHPDLMDQTNLQAVITNCPELNVVHLPREYCTFDLCKEQTNAVLWSRQASRIHREA